MQRKEARALALELIYEYEFHKDRAPQDFYVDALRLRELPGNDYALRLFLGVQQHREAMDGLIAQHSKNWSLSRISRVSLAILRLAVFEMRFDDQVETPIAINEAVELAKQYEGEDAYTFINGVLGGIAREGEHG
ncbi:MAG: transcription antitermination factor NusB [Clostridiales bacterium]|nr:transcription antitermination factor NusB [Clostridiales bacterium]